VCNSDSQQIMKQIITLFLLTLSINLLGQTKVVDLTDCLNENSNSPKEYILNLFKTNDIVIIGERDHRDTTQYDLLLDIFGDKRFIEEVGFIYTEVGCINRTEWANEVLKSNYENDSEFETELIKLYRELDFNPLWEKYNMYKYLKGIYAINKNLEPHKKITIGLTDVAFNWEDMTTKKYKKFTDFVYKGHTRDSIMAANFIQLYEKQIKQTGNRKALLIQSIPHAIKMDLRSYKSNYSRTGGYIFEKYNEKVKVVLFNEVNYGVFNSSNLSLIDDGRWDAAFELISHAATALDIESTPFGDTFYEDFLTEKIENKIGVKFKYYELADGIIFYKPFYEFKPTFGVPNVVDKTFRKELMRRTIMSQDKLFNRIGLNIIQPFYKKKNAKYYNNIRTFHDYENKSLRAQMKKWIKD